jgi:protein-S-isoprenylcysteine O-methyltransferase Ste14
MSLKTSFEKEGNWLFKRRGFLPLVLFPVAAIVIFLSEPAPHFGSLFWNSFSLCISLAGLLIRALVVGYAPAATSGRNTEGQVAETVNTTGMYSIIRHPLYLGNFLMWAGPIIFVDHFGFFSCMCLAYWLYYERIMYAEESFLISKFGEQYTKWSENVPAFFPGRFRWVQPALPFSLRNVLKREYSGVLAMGVTFSFLNILQHLSYRAEAYLDPYWATVLAISLVSALVLRSLKKHTGLLNVAGR